MSSLINTTGDTNEWNIVSNKKSKQWISANNGNRRKNKKKSYKRKKIINNVNDNTNTVHFIPKTLKTYIDNLLRRGLTSYVFFEEIDKEVKINSNIRTSVIVYILNEAACLDKLDIIEYILNNIKNRNIIVNTKSGFMEYTPIFNSAYKGSIKALKMLCCGGADLTSKNKLGETVLQALEQGRIDAINKDPSYKIFINDRYDECKLFLSNFEYKEKKYFKKETHIAASQSQLQKLEFTDISNLSISDLVDEYYDDIDKIVEFLEFKENDNILIEIICNVLERNIDIINNFLSILTIIGLCGYKKNIIDCLNNDIVQEFINLDSPYAKSKINEILEELS
jgi:hypothetical protein